jgi:hypothetical protein
MRSIDWSRRCIQGAWVFSVDLASSVVSACVFGSCLGPALRLNKGLRAGFRRFGQRPVAGIQSSQAKSVCS